MADGSRHNIHSIAEVTYGVTPATPTFATLRHTGTTLALSKNTIMSEELRADRQIQDYRHGTKQTGGDLSVEMSYGSFDQLLEAALCGTWASNVLKAGITRRSFTLMRHFSDLAGPAMPYHIFRGQEVTKFSLSVAVNAIVKGTFSFVGKSMEVASAAPAGSVLSAASTTGVMDSFSGAINEDGAPIAVVTEISLNLENGIEPRFVLGSAETIRPSIGRSNISGQITAYFEDSSLLDKFINESVTSLEFELFDGTSKYTFLLPQIKFTGGQPDTQGQGPMTLSMPFQALYDATEASNIVVTRDPGT